MSHVQPPTWLLHLGSHQCLTFNMLTVETMIHLPTTHPTRLLTLLMYDFFLSLIPYTMVFLVLPAKYDLSESINHVLLSCLKLFSGSPLHLAWNPRFIRPPGDRAPVVPLSSSRCWPLTHWSSHPSDTLTSSTWHTDLLHLTHWPPSSDTLASTWHTDLLHLPHWPPPSDTLALVISLALS